MNIYNISRKEGMGASEGFRGISSSSTQSHLLIIGIILFYFSVSIQKVHSYM